MDCTKVEFEEACEALDCAEESVRDDTGEEAIEAGWSDIVAAVASQFRPEVARELCRVKLGWEPADVRRHTSALGPMEDLGW